jgi:hypothetical protein
MAATDSSPDLKPLPRPPEQMEMDGWLKEFEGIHVERHPSMRMGKCIWTCEATTSMSTEPGNR